MFNLYIKEKSVFTFLYFVLQKLIQTVN